MTLANGTRLGPYEILAPIGAGGMGEVYKARDTRLDRVIALKVSKTEFNPRFGQEARAVAALNHPNICALYDVGPNYLVMEYVDGAELKGPLPVARAVELAGQILDALAAAHKRGITHRDLKPANIMVTKSGVKVLDFGLAKMGQPGSIGGDGSTTLTAEGTIAGTLHYMAPEQLQGREVDTRADIFSFGCVLYEMLTGKRAFDGSNGASVIAAVMERPAPSVAQIAPAALDRVLQTCLAKDPDQRCQNARDLRRELMWAVETPSVKAPVSSRSRLSAIIAGMLAVLLAALALVHFREKPQPAQLARFSILPPEKGTFDIGGGTDIPAISPDGRRLILNVRGADGATQLWIRSLDAIVPRPLAGTEHSVLPFWSPDGISIGFFAGGKLKRIEAAGGPVLTLADAPAPAGGTWSADGLIVYGTGHGQPLRKVPASGGASSLVTKLEAVDQLHFMPWFLPDGKHFLFAADKNVQGTGSRIRIGSLESPEVRTVIDADSQAIYSPDPHSGHGHLLFMRGHVIMAQPFDPKNLTAGSDAVAVAERVGSSVGLAAFSASGNGTLVYAPTPKRPGQLTSFDRTGKRLATFGEPDSFGPRLEFSPDRSKIATSITDSTSLKSDVWIHDVTRGLTSRFTFGPGENRSPRWSPDAGMIAFTSDRKGHSDLYRKPANGAGGEELLYADGFDKFPDSWSPDGKVLLYESLGLETAYDLWILPGPWGKPGISKPYPFLATPFNEISGQFSPDGKWIAYSSDESGRYEVYVTPFPGPGGKWQISIGGGAGARWRSDSKEILYQALDDRMMAADVTAKGTTLEVGKAHAVSGPLPNFDFDVSADGQRFLMSVPVQSGPESLTLVQNWMAALKLKK
jgi:eukaryotic-like serine/threonine-protein kinase